MPESESGLSPLTFSRLHHVNARRCGEAFHAIGAWTPTDWACALAGEVGEACNIIKKMRRLETSMTAAASVAAAKGEHSDTLLLTDELADELADAVMYIDLLATRMGIYLEGAIVRKFNKVSRIVGSQHTL